MRKRSLKLIKQDVVTLVPNSSPPITLTHQPDIKLKTPSAETIHVQHQPDIRLRKPRPIYHLGSAERLRLTAAQKEKLKLVGDEIGKSKQSRFNTTGRSGVFSFITAFMKDIEQREIPMSGNNSYQRDAWLASVINKEPFLRSVLDQVVTVDRNRGWNMLGGRRYVRHASAILHDIKIAPDIKGWRAAMSQFSQCFHGADIGTVIETEWYLNRVAALYPVDPTKCALTGRNDFPLQYLGGFGIQKDWSNNDYVRIVDSPQYIEGMHGLGYCSVSRAIELAKIMIALWQHDKEKLLATAPKGILLLKGISEQQWDDTLTQHEAQMTEMERRYYQGVQVLASDGITDVDARMLSLSEVPENISQESFTNLLMMFYALAFKYDPREFWPVSGGTFGTSMEANLQDKKATQKGGMDFILSIQESLQDLLPETIEFEFEQRDSQAEAGKQDLNAAIINNILMLTTPVGAEQTPLISRRQALNLLAEEDIIPQEWTAENEVTMAEDTDDNPGENIIPQSTMPISLVSGISDYSTIHLADGVSGNTYPEGLKGNKIKLSSSEKDQLYYQGEQIRLLPAVERSLYYSPEEPIVQYKYKDQKHHWTVIPTPLPIKKFYSIPE